MCVAAAAAAAAAATATRHRGEEQQRQQQQQRRSPVRLEDEHRSRGHVLFGARRLVERRGHRPPGGGRPVGRGVNAASQWRDRDGDGTVRGNGCDYCDGRDDNGDGHDGDDDRHHGFVALRYETQTHHRQHIRLGTEEGGGECRWEFFLFLAWLAWSNLRKNKSYWKTI